MWTMVIFVAALLAASAAVAMLRRGAAPFSASVFLRRTALVFMAATTLITGVFLAGEAISDPGGWAAALLISLWLVPAAVLSALAWYRPGWATAALAILAAGVTALGVWYAADPAWWHALENARGPVRAVATFILVLPAALAGRRRPLTGAVLLLVLGLLPLISSAAAGYLAASTVAISGPAVLGGLLYLLAAISGRRGGSRHAATRPLRRGGAGSEVS